MIGTIICGCSCQWGSDGLVVKMADLSPEGCRLNARL